MASTTRSRNTQARASYRCTECGWTATKWVGRCGECQAWGSVAEVGTAPAGRTAAAPVTTPAVPIGTVSAEQAVHHSSGVPELDRVLGGGIVPGAAVLLAGEPGVGKSTLLLEVAARTAAGHQRTLYVTGEESAAQVRLRADRTDAVHDELYLAAETDLGAVLTHIEDTRPRLVVVDSVQTIGASGVEGVPGGVTQVKEVAAALVRVAKTRGITVVLVGHVTKDGSIAGPRVLEHLVDVVLHFEGESGSRFRMLRAVKNRFGPVDEVGCFDLGPDGITTVTDPTGIFVERHHGRVAGTCVAVTMEGRRPMLAEVQSLVAEASSQDRPRRTTSGVDGSRLAMVLAVLHQHCGITLGGYDVFASTVGGAKITEPAADLALAIALASSRFLSPAPAGVVAMGEIGLSGELRRVRDVRQRLAEAARLGFELAVVPAEPGSPGTYRSIDDMRVVEAPDVRTALRLLHLDRALKVVEGG
ncbi:DNA repair protein RadA [Nocardioides bizhenqiangii]|uniref:DNA repair protein RadA n=1 Tax=Nocardioides bizhenqiangii TaxID=3095076 RepID=A0ABZ0ZRH5_9ACTN|nr:MULTISPECIES: DNA repair protein RadA [unclassified Nocardioides]MDZ5622668.1 DNA repair protein RadA [Nocardioides sp. HM23]WQQ26935.1 DNA repair protein RadA [Nocardioides sp. HM61]